MTPERFRRLEELFLEAIDCDAARRAEFLDGACGEDAALRAEIEAMLMADSGTHPVLAQSIERAVESFGELVEFKPPERVGPYRIVREIGHGGMGVVYLAERADKQFAQQVAIKIIRQSMDSELTRNRFVRERQVLAQLNHPGIARLLDGGATENGQPYFAMEYVEGLPLGEFCEKRKLALGRRLEIFRKICEAVQYAHRNLVVHRDIKPGNILVTEEGQPKLLDFGIAKLIEDNDDGAPATRTQAAMLTPDYASPEQVRGAAVTTSTDVYSLGCVLYEMLAGRRAHQFASQSAGEMERVICDIEPELPSLHARLDDDIDNIVMKALRKEPSARYETAGQFGEDIANYLEGRPVLARKATISYRVSKFVRRNRVMVGAGVIALVAIIGGAGVAVWQARRASAQAEVAERRFREGRKLANTILSQVDEKLRNLTGSMEARRMIVESGVAYLDNLSREAAGDESLQLELARAYERIGEVQGTGQANLGQTAEARKSFDRAIELLEKLGDAPGVRATLASVYLKNHMVAQRMAEPEVARAYVHKAIAAASAAFAVDGENGGLYRLITAAYRSLTTIELRAGNAEAAMEANQKAYELTARWVATHPGDASDASLASALESLAMIALRDKGDLAFARAKFQEVAPLRERMYQKQKSSGSAILLARTYNLYGDLLASPFEPNLGEREEGLRFYKKALALREEVLASDPGSAPAKSDVAFSLFNIAALLRDTAPAEAVTIMRRAMDLLAAPKNPEEARGLALVKMMCASALGRVGQRERALGLLAESLDVLSAMLEKEPGRKTLSHEVMTVRLERADVLICLRRGMEAEAELRAALALGERAGGLRIAVLVKAARERLQSPRCR